MNNKIRDDISYASMQLRLAVKCLLGKEPIRERLKLSFANYLIKLNRSSAENDFSDQLKPEWEYIKDRLKTVGNMSEDDAANLSEKIFEFYDKSLIDN